jgi:hypothetical protein
MLVSDKMVRYFAAVIREALNKKFYFLSMNTPKIFKNGGDTIERCVVYYISDDADKIVVIFDSLRAGDMECHVVYHKFKRVPVKIDLADHYSVIEAIRHVASPIEGMVYEN